MLTYQERIELRDKLVNAEIGIESAIAQFWNGFEEGQRSWHTKDWKERRDRIIKDKCEICGSNDTLTLQHRSHPKKYSEYLSEITRSYAENHINTKPDIDQNEFSNYILAKYEYLPTPLCPKCKDSNPSKRVRKKPEYRCTACKHEFDNPIYISFDALISIFFENEDAIEAREKCFVSNDKWRNKHNLSNIRYWMQREQAKNAESETIKKEAFLLYLNDDIKYLSFEDTITACKRCASGYDLFRMDLCPQCKEYYKGIQYPTCIQCLPEEKRKSVLESIGFGNDWRKMHEDRGID